MSENIIEGPVDAVKVRVCALFLFRSNRCNDGSSRFWSQILNVSEDIIKVKMKQCKILTTGRGDEDISDQLLKDIFMQLKGFQISSIKNILNEYRENPYGDVSEQ